VLHRSRARPSTRIHSHRAFLDFITDDDAAHPYPPTVREIGDAIGIRSTCVATPAAGTVGLSRRQRD
jgi:hypothetical protein